MIELPTAGKLVSPRLGVTFELSSLDELRIIRPDGRPFVTVEELHGERDQLQQRVEQERKRAEQAIAEVKQLRQRLKSLRLIDQSRPILPDWKSRAAC